MSPTVSWSVPCCCLTKGLGGIVPWYGFNQKPFTQLRTMSPANVPSWNAPLNSSMIQKGPVQRKRNLPDIQLSRVWKTNTVSRKQMTFLCPCGDDRRKLCIVVVNVRVGPCWLVGFPRLRVVVQVDVIQIGTLTAFLWLALVGLVSGTRLASLFPIQMPSERGWIEWLFWMFCDMPRVHSKASHPSRCGSRSRSFWGWFVVFYLWTPLSRLPEGSTMCFSYVQLRNAWWVRRWRDWENVHLDRWLAVSSIVNDTIGVRKRFFLWTWRCCHRVRRPRPILYSSRLPRWYIW